MLLAAAAEALCLFCTGQPLARLPVDPMYGRAILASVELGCVADVLAIVAVISTDMSVLYSPRDKKEEAAEAHKHFFSQHGDHLTLLSVFRAFTGMPKPHRSRWCRGNFCNVRALQKAEDIYHQLQQHVAGLRMSLTATSAGPIPVLKSLVAGLFPHAALRQPDGK
jgi:ATP-dependent RNA helicase DHX8/PRP22